MASVLCMLFSSVKAQKEGQEKPTAEQFWQGVIDQGKGMTFDEYRQGFLSMNPDINEEHIAYSFRIGDANDDGALQQDEFTKLFNQMASGIPDGDQIWSQVADPKKGMTMEEFRVISRRTEPVLKTLTEQKLTDWWVQFENDAFTMTDENKDGTLQYDEFTKLYNKKYGEKLDTSQPNGEPDFEKTFLGHDYNNNGSLSQTELAYGLMIYGYDIMTVIQTNDLAFGGQFKLDNNGGMNLEEYLNFTASFGEEEEEEEEERGMGGIMDEFMEGDHIMASMGGTKIMIKMGASMLQASALAAVSTMTLY